MNRARSRTRRDHPPIRGGRLLLGLALMLGSAWGVALLLYEGFSARAMIVIGVTFMLTGIRGLWFAIRGRWDW